MFEKYAGKVEQEAYVRDYTKLDEVKINAEVYIEKNGIVMPEFIFQLKNAKDIDEDNDSSRYAIIVPNK